MCFKKLKTKDIKKEITNLAEKQSKKCLKCNSDVKRTTRGKQEVICSWKSCNFRTNIWKDTIFYKTKRKKEKILRILELWMQKASYNLISYITRINRKVIWKLMVKVSKKLSEIYYEKCNMIGGNNTIFEIDESKFGKRMYKRRHKVEGVWIFGIVKRSGQRKIHLVAVNDRNAETFTGKLTDNVNNVSIIFSFYWKGHNCVINEFADHLHVNHIKNFKDPISGTLTNTIEGNWAHLNMQVPFRGRT